GVVLAGGRNLIPCVAPTRRGASTAETRTVIADWTARVLENLEPAEDVTLAWGQSLTVRFTSEEGLEAAFEVIVSGAGTSDVPGRPMEEVEPGVYEGTYTAPAGVTFENAAIQINARDAAGNLTIATAPGRLTVEAAAAGPELEVTEPEDGTVTNRDAIRVSGVATDEQGIESVTANGRRAAVNADGTFTIR